MPLTAYFLLPDIGRPSGGVWFTYQVVDALNDLGIAAKVYQHDPAFRCTWFDHTTPVVAGDTLDLERGDLLVVPEWWGNEFAPGIGAASVVVFNQNHFGTFHGAGFDDTWRGAYPGWPNARAVIVTSRSIESFMGACLTAPLPVHRIPYFLDPEIFRPGPKSSTFAFMPRRRRGDAEAVLQLLHRDERSRHWQVASLDGMDRAAVGDALGRSAVFLSFSDREGFGLPPAEAMAAGAYVVGFDGFAGREFMSADWCSPVEDPDLAAFAEAAAAAAHAHDTGAPWIDRAVERARQHITEEYSREAFLSHLTSTFDALLGPGSDAGQPRPVTVTHFGYRSGRKRVEDQLHRWLPPVVQSRLFPQDDG